MRKLRLMPLVVIIVFLINGSNVFADNETDLKLYARSAILMDADSGRILYAENAEAVMAVASTTKIMTCILAVESGRMDEVVTVSKEAAKQPKVKLYLKVNEQYYLRDLLYSLMLESHNDTAVAIAEHLGGSVEAFADLMNQKAQELGCTHTYFVTPNGLDATRDGRAHESTAKDMAIIASYAIQNEIFLDIIQTGEYGFSDVTQTRSHRVYNKDAFLTSYDGAIGIKTGFTTKAGYCFVGAASRDERTFVSVVLGCGWPPNKSWKWSDTRMLMNYGMDHFRYRDITSPAYSGTITVVNGQETAVSIHKPEVSARLLLADTDEVLIDTEMKQFLQAPVAKETCIGYEIYYINGEEWSRVPICTINEVGEWNFMFVLQKVCGIFWL